MPQSDREKNRFTARARRYARVGANVGGVAARMAGARFFGLSLDRAKNANSPLFIVKVGVALELRLRDRARATKDIDIVLRDTTADLADSIEQALTGEFSRSTPTEARA